MSESEQEPGRYESDIEGLGGYIRFPFPFMWEHLKLWWAESIGKLRGKGSLDLDTVEVEFLAARRLIAVYGEWAIEGVTLEQAEALAVPADLMSFVIESADAYIWPHLPEKKRRLILTTI